MATRRTGGLAKPAAYAAFMRSLDAAQKTRETYARALRRWRAYLEAQGAAETEATRETVIAYRDALADQGKTAATVNAYLTAVRRFYAYLEAERVYPNIAAGVKGLRRNPRSPRDALTREQAARLLSRPADGLAGLRDRAMINLMMRRGLRAVEIVRADIGDLRQIGGEAVLYVQGKGYHEKADFVVLNDACLRPIYRYLEARGETDPHAPLFAGAGNRNKGGRLTTRTVSRTVKEALVREGIASARLTAHSLRHTAVTAALLGGATVQEAQAMARHASVTTTMIYAHNLDRMRAGAENAADAYLDGARIQDRTQSEHNMNTVLPAETVESEHKIEHNGSTKRAQSEHTGGAAWASCTSRCA